MIRIEKNFQKIPATLLEQSTIDARLELVKVNSYLSKYDEHYKTSAIKEALEELYNFKCVYCEQITEEYHVEHFRPKSVYWWLAFSWDNLMCVCVKCNRYKLDKFETTNQKIAFAVSDLDDIHNLTRKYNQEEGNLFFNPEIDDPEPLIGFNFKGNINSSNSSMNYTITECKLDRPYLCRERVKLYNDVCKKINDKLLEFKINKDKNILIEIKAIKESFIKDSKNPENEFLAYRHYIVKHFLNEK